MVTLVRTAQAFPGKIGELIVLAKEIAAVHKRLLGSELIVGHAFGSDPTQAAWIGKYDDLGQVAEMLSKLAADREYQSVLVKLGSVIVPGSIRDQIWRHL